MIWFYRCSHVVALVTYKGSYFPWRSPKLCWQYQSNGECLADWWLSEFGGRHLRPCWSLSAPKRCLPQLAWWLLHHPLWRKDRASNHAQLWLCSIGLVAPRLTRRAIWTRFCHFLFVWSRSHTADGGCFGKCCRSRSLCLGGWSVKNRAKVICYSFKGSNMLLWTKALSKVKWSRFVYLWDVVIGLKAVQYGCNILTGQLSGSPQRHSNWDGDRV